MLFRSSEWVRPEVFARVARQAESTIACSQDIREEVEAPRPEPQLQPLNAPDRWDIREQLPSRGKAVKPAPAPAPAPEPEPVAEAPKDAAKSASAPAREIFFLQAGAFQSAPDADNLKARLALMGMEATVQTTTLPDKGVWHRVRVGPYTTVDDLNRARDTLKQSGIDTTLIKVREAPAQPAK